jgi:1,4-dihydroxy-6-naphthoate synthase
MDPDVQARHIALYVNDFSVDLGADGRAAIDGLLGRAAAAGLVPRVDPRLLC